MNDHPAKKQKLPTDKLFAVGTDMAAMYYSMLQEQFFLPADAIEFLESIGWRIDPVVVMSGSTYWHHWLKYTTKFEPSRDIVESAQYVGVSERYNPATDDRLVIAKLWFPAIDTDKNEE